MKLKDILLEINIGSIPWYRGGNKKIDKFDYNRIRDNDEHITNYHGYGIYFISKLDSAKKYGDIVTEVKISSSANILNGKVNPKQCKQIYDGLHKNGFKIDKERDERVWLNPDYGKYSILNDIEEVYDAIGRWYKLNTKKEVSDFLLSCGIDGMFVKNDVNDEIIIIFNDNVINVVGTL